MMLLVSRSKMLGSPAIFILPLYLFPRQVLSRAIIYPILKPRLATYACIWCHNNNNNDVIVWCHNFYLVTVFADNSFFSKKYISFRQKVQPKNCVFCANMYFSVNLGLQICKGVSESVLLLTPQYNIYYLSTKCFHSKQTQQSTSTKNSPKTKNVVTLEPDPPLQLIAILNQQTFSNDCNYSMLLFFCFLFFFCNNCGQIHKNISNDGCKVRDQDSYALFSPLTPIINTNTVSLKHLVSISVKFHF